MVNKQRFFHGLEVENIAKELSADARLIERHLFESINYSELIFRVAEILEVENLKSADLVEHILFETSLDEERKAKLYEMVKSKDQITYSIFETLRKRSFSSIIEQITSLSGDTLIQRRIEYSILESIFHDLRHKDNMLSAKLAKAIGVRYNLSVNNTIIRTLEKNNFILASRDLVKILSDRRAINALNNYRTGSKDTSAGKYRWDTSEDIRNARKSYLPDGVEMISTTPDPLRNQFYFFNQKEINILNHYFEMVRSAELKKGNIINDRIGEYYNDFTARIAPTIKTYVTERFGERWINLKHLIITGIGGNEMLADLIKKWAELYNKNLQVHFITFPSKWSQEVGYSEENDFNKKHSEISLNKDNLLVIALTRSGKTYETAKTCEFLCEVFGAINIIGVSNGGAVLEITRKNKGCEVEFPKGIAGRLSTLVTPVFPLPMTIIDEYADEKITSKFMKIADKYDTELSLKNENSIAWLCAKKIFISSYVNGSRLLIYQGSNSNNTMKCFRHMEQVIMEGIKHSITCILPKSMPDAAHFNMEQTLKLAEQFYHFWIIEKKPLQGYLGTIELDGLNINEQLAVLTKGQFEKIKQKSPIDLILVENLYDISTQAFIYKFVENTMYYLARLLGDDPEGNPDVKDVRDLSGLAEKSYKIKKRENNQTIVDFYYELENQVLR